MSDRISAGVIWEFRPAIAAPAPRLALLHSWLAGMERMRGWAQPRGCLPARGDGSQQGILHCLIVSSVPGLFRDALTTSKWLKAAPSV